MAEYTTIDDFFDGKNYPSKRVRVPAHILTEYNERHGTEITEMAVTVRRDVKLTDSLFRSLMPSLGKLVVDAANRPHNPPVTGMKKTDIRNY